MNVVPFDRHVHYGEICRWWVRWNFPVTDIDHLPDTGAVVIDGDKLLAAGFLLIPADKHVPMAFMEWVTGNPDIERNYRHQALQYLIDTLCEAAASAGFPATITFTHNKKFNKFLQEIMGFQVAGEGYTGLLRYQGCNVNKGETK